MIVFPLTEVVNQSEEAVASIADGASTTIVPSDAFTGMSETFWLTILIELVSVYSPSSLSLHDAKPITASVSSIIFNIFFMLIVGF
jgi:hypothetical protein